MRAAGQSLDMREIPCNYCYEEMLLAIDVVTLLSLLILPLLGPVRWRRHAHIPVHCLGFGVVLQRSITAFPSDAALFVAACVIVSR